MYRGPRVFRHAVWLPHRHLPCPKTHTCPRTTPHVHRILLMAPATIVGRTVEQHSLSPAERAAARTKCEIDGHLHGIQASYGVTRLENIMTMFDLVSLIDDTNR